MYTCLAFLYLNKMNYEATIYWSLGSQGQLIPRGLFFLFFHLIKLHNSDLAFISYNFKAKHGYIMSPREYLGLVLS